MELYCPLGIRALSRKHTDHALVLFSYIINPLLTKLVRSKWLDIWPRSFFACLKKRKKRTWPISSHLDLTLGQYPIHLARSGYGLCPASTQIIRFGVVLPYNKRL